MRTTLITVLAVSTAVPFAYILWLYYGGMPLDVPGWMGVGALTGLALWGWALWDWGSRIMAKHVKVLWLIVLLTIGPLGAFCYFLSIGNSATE